MRTLYLVNEKGQTYFLDHRSQTLISSLDGIGFEFDCEHQKYDNTYLVVNKSIPLQEMSLELIFLRGYLGYREWSDFVSSSVEMRLFYTSDVTKFCYVNIKSSSKGELEGNAIKSKVVIERLSLWIVKRSSEISVEEDTSKKLYPYPYGYTYSISYNGRKSITNQSNFAAPVKVVITGAVNNPRLTIEKDGEPIARLQLFVVDSNCRLEVEANPTNQYMKKFKNNVETDIYDLQNFEYENFLYLPSGTYDFYFEPGVSRFTKCTIITYEGYIGN